MKVTRIDIEDVLILEPKVFGDDRGYFFESFNQNTWKELCGPEVFVQDNESKSSYGVIRGLHYQVYPKSQAKLVRVMKGSVKDVIIDIRPESKTYGQKFEIILSEENKKQMFVPKGFAHGFSVLSDYAIFFYKCDEYYYRDMETGIHPADPTLNIDWGIPKDKMLLSPRDEASPKWGDHTPYKQ